MIVFLVGFSIYALFKQFDAIRQFTEEKPRQIETTALIGNEPALGKLRSEMLAFQTALDGNELASIKLSAADINLLIAADERFRDLRGTFRVEKIASDAMHLTISFPLNGKPRFTRDGESGIITSDMRYLNGTLIARPGLLKKEIVLRIEQITDTPSKVPEEFIGQMSPYRISERYLTDSVIGPVMSKLTRVELSEGAVVFSRKPGELPADAFSDVQVESASQRLFIVLGIVATVFLIFVAGMIFWQQRRRASAGKEP